MTAKKKCSNGEKAFSAFPKFLRFEMVFRKSKIEFYMTK